MMFHLKNEFLFFIGVPFNSKITTEAQKKVDELQKKIDELQKQNAVLQIDKNFADLNQGTADGAMANRRQGWSATTSSALTPEDSSLVKDVLAMEDQNEQH